MDIIVLAGGLSTERDVSFKTGSMVASALKENGHRVILLDVFMGYSDKEENLDGIFDRADEISVKVDDIPEVAPDLAAVKASRKDQSPCFFGPNVIRMCQMADIVFMALHGENGENGKLQAAFDLLGVKYTGSDYLSSAIAMNKGMAKQLFASAGIPAPRGIAMKKENREDDVTKLPLTLPCVVKPCCGGSSIGVTIVRDAAEFKKALDEAFHWEDELVIEEYVKGREFSVGVIEGKALPVIEIAPIQGFYDYKNKYKAGSAVETCPADLPEEVSAQIRKQTANPQSRNRCRRKNRQDTQCFGKAYLNRVGCKSQCVGYKSQHYIKCCNHSSLNNKCYLFVSHIHLSPLVLFYEWKVSNTR